MGGAWNGLVPAHGLPFNSRVQKGTGQSLVQLPRVRRGASRLKTERGRDPSVNSRTADSRLECQAWAATAGLAASGRQGHGPRGSAGCALPTAAPHAPSSYAHSLGKAERLGSANAASQPWTRLRILSPAKEMGIEEWCAAPVPVFAGRLTLGPQCRGQHLASPAPTPKASSGGGCILLSLPWNGPCPSWWHLLNATLLHTLTSLAPACLSHQRPPGVRLSSLHHRASL